MAINYHGCKVNPYPSSTIVAPSGLVLEYALRKARKWNIGLRRHATELTGEITVYFPPDTFGASGVKHFPDWSSACEYVAGRYPGER